MKFEGAVNPDEGRIFHYEVIFDIGIRQDNILQVLGVGLCVPGDFVCLSLASYQMPSLPTHDSHLFSRANANILAIARHSSTVSRSRWSRGAGRPHNVLKVQVTREVTFKLHNKLCGGGSADELRLKRFWKIIHRRWWREDGG